MSGRWIVIGVGLAGIGLAILAAFLVSRRERIEGPGRLISHRESLRWRSPEPSVGAGSGPRLPMFELVNVGGAPVRVLSARTNCGCAPARVEPALVPPRGTARVIVDAKPLEVGVRAATITLETDPPDRSEAVLQLFIEGYRTPPYILEVTGDLFYRAGYSRDEVREIVVKTVEPASGAGKGPRISCDLPLFRLDEPTVSEKPFITDPSMTVRTYEYGVRFVAGPPRESFQGVVSVYDPWISDRMLYLNVSGEANPAIRAIPSRLILTVKGPEDARSSAIFQARASRHGAMLRAEAEGGDESPLLVESLNTSGGSDSHPFRVRLKPGRPVAEGVFHIVVRSEAPDPEALRVPVLVRHRGA